METIKVIERAYEINLLLVIRYVNVFFSAVVLLSILYMYKVQSTTNGLIWKVYVPVTIIVITIIVTAT